MNELRALELVFAALDEVNQMLPEDRRLERSPEVHLVGREARLDSMGLVTLIVCLEELIQERLGVTVTIADELAMSRTSSPFRTVATLAAFVDELVASGEAGD